MIRPIIHEAVRKRMRNILTLSLACAALLAATGCEATAESHQQEASQAQARAEEDKRAAAATLATAKAKADTEVMKAEEKAREETVAAQTKADKSQNEADKSLTKSRIEYQVDAQKALDNLVTRRQEAEKKIAHLVAPQTVVKAAILDVQGKENILHGELKSLQNASAETLEYVKLKVDRELTDLTRAVSDLEGRTKEI
jgi:hypothetical protein